MDNHFSMKNKTFKILFFSVASIFIFVGFCNSSQAADNCATGYIKAGYPAGICSSGGCDDGWDTLIAGEECATNIWDDNCCVQIGSLKTEYAFKYADPALARKYSAVTEPISATAINEPVVAEDYKNPSLIRCGDGDAGLCYDKNVGCPAGISSIPNSNCGYLYVCCPVVGPSQKCGARDGVCVDENTICTNEDKTNSSACGTGEKCCLESIPYNEDEDENAMTVKSNDPVAYDSQCNFNNQECNHDSDRVILTNQCEALLSSSNCGSMPAYLDALADQCIRIEAPGFDCNLIKSNGYYGNEAKKFADYYITQVAGAEDGAETPAGEEGTGGLDFESIVALGLPDAVGGVKAVLVNIVQWMLGIFGLLALIAFIISGGQYLLASGDDKMIETAKKNMTYSVIGIIVALSGFVIIRAIDAALRATGALF